MKPLVLGHCELKKHQLYICLPLQIVLDNRNKFVSMFCMYVKLDRLLTETDSFLKRYLF